MNCPKCGEKINLDTLLSEHELEEAIVQAAATAIAFRHRQVGFGALKEAADNLRRLKQKYGVE